MSLKDLEDMTPRSLVNPKSISAAIEYFFGRGELSQVVDQTNPLSMLTHERRLSALGPGGLNRKRAGFEVRDVHISHYGRICPIETPEGTNIGLISSLAIYAGVDEYGFLVTPYQKVKNGKLTDDDRLAAGRPGARGDPGPGRRADRQNGKLVGDTIIARYHGDFEMVPGRPGRSTSTWRRARWSGVSAGLIPFLEHDDANRALMGSNMQRQAVPLLITEPPLVATGPGGRGGAELEHARPRPAARARSPTSTPAGSRSTATSTSCASSWASTSGPARTRSRSSHVGEKVEKGQIIADGAATYQGELALGRNVLVGLHGLGRLQLRGRHHHQRGAGARRHLHLDPHRGVRHRNPRDQAGPRGVHPRHPQRQREDAAQPRRERHRPRGHLRASRATSWWARSRPSRRPS